MNDVKNRRTLWPRLSFYLMIFVTFGYGLMIFYVPRLRDIWLDLDLEASFALQLVFVASHWACQLGFMLAPLCVMGLLGALVWWIMSARGQQGRVEVVDIVAENGA